MMLEPFGMNNFSILIPLWDCRLELLEVVVQTCISLVFVSLDGVQSHNIVRFHQVPGNPPGGCPPELLDPGLPPPGYALPDGLDWSAAPDPVPPPGPFGGPPPPDALGLVCRGVHSLGHLTAVEVAVPCCLNSGRGGGGGILRPDVTCPSDFPDSGLRKEVVHHEQIPDQDMSKLKKNAADKKSNFVIKQVPVTPKAVASSQGTMRERWLVSIYKEILAEHGY